VTGGSPLRSRRVWFISAVHRDNIESTTHILAQLAAALAGVYHIGEIKVAAANANSRTRGWPAPRWMFQRLWSAIGASVQVAIGALRSLRAGDVVLVVTNPPLLPLMILPIARLRRSRIVMVVHDVYPDVLYAAGLLAKRSLFARMLELLNRRAFRGADRTIVIGRDMKWRVESKLGAGISTVVFIPNWADADISPAPHARYAFPPLIVQYSGNMGLTHPVETLLDCAELLQRSGAPVVFEVYGWGFKLAFFSAELERRGISNISLIPPCPRPLLRTQLARCDIGLVLMSRNMEGVSVPSRAYNILAAGRPLLVAAGVGAEVATMVAEHKLGWVVPPQDAVQLAAAVEDVIQRRSELPAMGRRAAALAAEEYALHNAVRRYRAVIDEL
jgi:colanic acid biosynthesis glycosyl transferase WcaI